jgi:hypothetical protein
MKQVSRIVAFALMVPVFALAACDEDPEDEGDPADEIEFVRLTVSTQSVTINSAGTATGGPITIARNASGTVTATFLRANNTTVTLPGQFEIRLTPQAGLTFARTSAFSGTLTAGATAGTVPVSVELFHTGENHVDWGGANHRFNVTVQ